MEPPCRSPRRAQIEAAAWYVRSLIIPYLTTQSQTLLNQNTFLPNLRDSAPPLIARVVSGINSDTKKLIEICYFRLIFSSSFLFLMAFLVVFFASEGSYIQKNMLSKLRVVQKTRLYSDPTVSFNVAPPKAQVVTSLGINC